jgi:hypothetical protein
MYLDTHVDEKESWPRLLALTSFPFSCRESNPMLYQAFWALNCRFAPFRSNSVPLVTCGFVFES